MYNFKTLKELAAHPSVRLIERRRGELAIVLADGWVRLWDGGITVTARDAAAMLELFNAGQICTAADRARAPLTITFTDRAHWGGGRADGVKGCHVSTVRMGIVGIGPSGVDFRTLEVLSETGRPPFDWARSAPFRASISWESLTRRPSEYGLAASEEGGMRNALARAQTLEEMEALYEKWIGHRDHGQPDEAALRAMLVDYIDEVFRRAAESAASRDLRMLRKRFA